MSVKELTQKAINSIANTGYLNVWEGSVRSGKTVCSSLAWITYVSNSPESFFIMSGKTIATLYRNVIGGDFGLLAMLGSSGEYKIDREGNRLLQIWVDSETVKTCYCFGAHDQSSYQVMRGLTAGGWYADEVNLHPKSFVEEAFRRTIVSSDRKNFWTLNPDNPNHWIYEDYVDRYEAMGLPGFYLWKFTLDDNKAIPEERKDELKQQYAGIFYRRYILGERVLAEGIIYDQFSEHNLFGDEDIPFQHELNTVRTIAVDYGTTNPCHWLDIRDDGEVIWVMNEYRWDSKSDYAMRSGIGQKTDSQYADDMEEFVGAGESCEIVCDPSAASFIAELKHRMLYVTPAKNDVLDGIRAVSNMLALGRIRIHREKCKELIKEMRSYSWDEKAVRRGDEKPLKIQDHGPDGLRYYIYTKMPYWRTGISK